MSLSTESNFDPLTMPIEEIDVSRAEYYQSGVYHDIFRRLRNEAPVHYSKRGPTGPYWSITRHEDIIAIDTNHQVFSSDRDIVIGDQPDFFAPPMFIAMDPPVHDIQRKAAAPAVAPAQLSDLEALIRTRVSDILDSLPIGESFDWVDKVSIELTTQMLATLFDFPWDDRRLLPYWSDVSTTSDIVSSDGYSDEERMQILGTEALPYFTKLWHERAASDPKFDFISLLAHNPDTKDMINNPMEFLGNLMLLIVGGNDTTRNTITAGVHALNKFPDQYEKIKADRSLIPNMVSEFIRWQTPLAHMRRTALEDVEFQGQTIKKGDRVIMWYVSGNRDETIFENPDKVIVDRDNARRHVAFGFGIHRCMGNRVAEMQLRILWEEILERFDRIEVLAEPTPVQSCFVLGYKDMPVKIHA